MDIDPKVHRQKRILANYLPGGRIFGAARIDHETDPTLAPMISRLCWAIAEEFTRLEDVLYTFMNEIHPDGTVAYLEEWERALGLPDECFGLNLSPTIEERQLYVVVKLSALGIQTKEDFEKLAEIMTGGTTTVTVSSGMAEPWRTDLDPTYFTTDKEARNTIVIDYDYTENVFPFSPDGFPITFGDIFNDILDCLFSKLKPAYAQVVIRPTP